MDERYQEARQREVRQGNDDLPRGATRFSHPATDAILGELQVEEIGFLETFGRSPGLTSDKNYREIVHLDAYYTEVSQFGSTTFNGQEFPMVEGYNWYRGIAFKVLGGLIGARLARKGEMGSEVGSIFLFIGCMRPSEKGGAPDPIVYTRGNVNLDEVLRAVSSYAEARRVTMQEARAQITV